ncbi:ABC transporter substrate-binding protein [Kineococcus sp. LSe6-4]|uniref:ABC transporter substrate-binding protein n=1 Tax=Kineococcus halophytocola TaxID=3234027 RepID=A0ABV4GY15_9ACTN
MSLREDITFTDGTPVDGEGVRVDVEHLRSGSGQDQFMVAAAQSVDVVDPVTVEFRLAEPVPAFITYLGLVGGAMASPTAIAAGTLEQDPVGSGPYVPSPACNRPGGTCVHTRNPGCFAPEEFPDDTVRVLTTTDVTPPAERVEEPADQRRLHPPAERRRDGRQRPGRAAAGRRPAGFRHRRPGRTLLPALGDVRVRQALNTAVDTEGLLRAVLVGGGELTNQVFNSDSPAFAPGLEGTYRYDPERARRLLAEAGCTDGFDLTLPDVPHDSQINPTIAQQLGDVGVRVQWEPVAQDQTVPPHLSGRFPVFWFTPASASAGRTTSSTRSSRRPGTHPRRTPTRPSRGWGAGWSRTPGSPPGTTPGTSSRSTRTPAATCRPRTPSRSCAASDRPSRRDRPRSRGPRSHPKEEVTP